MGRDIALMVVGAYIGAFALWYVLVRGAERENERAIEEANRRADLVDAIRTALKVEAKAPVQS